MDAFFVPVHQYQHPYSVRVWTTSSYDGTSYLLTFDGVKIRLYDYMTTRVLREMDFLKRSALSRAISIYHRNFPSRAVFVLVRDRKNLMLLDENLTELTDLAFDTSITVLAMAYSHKRSLLFVAGNFGWLRAIKFDVTVTVTGTEAKWTPVWTRHDNGQWTSQLTVDDHRGILFSASGTDIFMWNIDTDEAQMIMKFETKHTATISSIRYSHEHLMFFTAAADGIIKTWRLFEKKPQNIHTIKQAPVGPMQLEIDDISVLCVSQERIIRRYNMMTGALMGLIDLDPRTSVEGKNMDDSVTTCLVAMQGPVSKRELIFECEAQTVQVLEVHFAPRELATCCTNVVGLVADRMGRVLALCKNNIVHHIHTDGQEVNLFDLDSMTVVNGRNSNVSPSLVTSMEIYGDQVVFGFESGMVKMLNVKTGELYEMKESNLGSRVMCMCNTTKFMVNRHENCSKARNGTEVVCSFSETAYCTMHCPLCHSYVSSWKWSGPAVIQVEANEMYPILFALERDKIRVWHSEGQTLDDTVVVHFEKNDIAERFAFVSDDVILVAFESGVCATYKVNYKVPSNPNLSHITRIAVCKGRIVKLCPCLDLLKIDVAVPAWRESELNGLCVAIGEDDTMKIVDCFAGAVVYQTSLPEHKTSLSATFAYQAKILLTISIDENLRLFDWPEFERPEALPPPSESSEEEEPAPPPEEEQPPSNVADKVTTDFGLESDRSAPPEEPTQGIKVNLSDFVTTTMPKQEQTVVLPPAVPKDKRKKMDLVLENGAFRLIVEGESSDNESSRIDEEIDFEDFMPPTPGKSWEEVMDANYRALHDMLEKDPSLANAFMKKPVKQLKKVEAYDELTEEEFMSLFLAINTKQLLAPQERRWSQMESRRTARYEENPEAILPIGARKGRHGRRKHSTRTRRIRIMYEDGTSIVTDHFTIDILKKMAARPGAQKPDEILPGLVFRKTVANIQKKGKSKRGRGPIVHERENVAPPIITLTDGGVFIGGSLRRWIENKPPIPMREQYMAFMKTIDSGRMAVNDFMHWEGVQFPDLGKHQKGIVGIRFEDEDDDYSGEEDQESREKMGLGRFLNRKKRKHGDKSKTGDDEGSSDEDEDEETSNQENACSSSPARKGDGGNGKNQFKVNVALFGNATNDPSYNLFDDKTGISDQLKTTSSTFHMYSHLMGSSDNPLLELLQNTPVMTKDEINAELHAGRLESIGQWNPLPNLHMPHIDNRFKVETTSGRNSVGGSGGPLRPGSPRVMDPLSEITRRMTFGEPLLPVISESSIPDFNEYDFFPAGSPESQSREGSSKGDRDGGSSQEKHRLTEQQIIVNEHMNRSDFKGLRDLLGEVGLLDKDGLIDLPTWQPTCKFLTISQKKGVMFDEKPSTHGDENDAEEEEINEEENASEGEGQTNDQQQAQDDYNDDPAILESGSLTGVPDPNLSRGKMSRHSQGRVTYEGDIGGDVFDGSAASEFLGHPAGSGSQVPGSSSEPSDRQHQAGKRSHRYDDDSDYDSSYESVDEERVIENADGTKTVIYQRVHKRREHGDSKGGGGQHHGRGPRDKGGRGGNYNGGEGGGGGNRGSDRWRRKNEDVPRRGRRGGARESGGKEGDNLDDGYYYSDDEGDGTNHGTEGGNRKPRHSRDQHRRHRKGTSEFGGGNNEEEDENENPRTKDGRPITGGDEDYSSGDETRTAVKTPSSQVGSRQRNRNSSDDLRVDGDLQPTHGSKPRRGKSPLVDGSRGHGRGKGDGKNGPGNNSILEPGSVPGDSEGFGDNSTSQGGNVTGQGSRQNLTPGSLLIRNPDGTIVEGAEGTGGSTDVSGETSKMKPSEGSSQGRRGQDGTKTRPGGKPGSPSKTGGPQTGDQKSDTPGEDGGVRRPSRGGRGTPHGGNRDGDPSNTENQENGDGAEGEGEDKDADGRNESGKGRRRRRRSTRDSTKRRRKTKAEDDGDDNEGQEGDDDYDNSKYSDDEDYKYSDDEEEDQNGEGGTRTKGRKSKSAKLAARRMTKDSSGKNKDGTPASKASRRRGGRKSSNVAGDGSNPEEDEYEYSEYEYEPLNAGGDKTKKGRRISIEMPREGSSRRGKKTRRDSKASTGKRSRKSDVTTPGEKPALYSGRWKDGKNRDTHQRTLRRGHGGKSDTDSLSKESILSSVPGTPISGSQDSGTATRKGRRVRKGKGGRQSETVSSGAASSDEEPIRRDSMDSEDEEALFQSFLDNTTTADEVEGFGSDARRPQKIEEVQGDRPTALGGPVELFDGDDFESLKLMKALVEYDVKDVMDLGKMRIRGANSTDDLLKKDLKRKRKIYTFSKIGIEQACKIQIEHHCPTLWDAKKGRMRRSSF